MTTWKNACATLVGLLLVVACDTGKDKVADIASADQIPEVAQDALGEQDASEPAATQDAATDANGAGDMLSENEAGDPDACQPNCDEIECDADGCHTKECGPDGCGGECGFCPEGYCEDGRCLHFDPSCDDVCVGVECGVVVQRFEQGPDYECECGWCEAGFDCQDGICVPQGCQPNCEGKACGDDGCGGSCGICGDGLDCLNTKFGQQCTTQCELFSCPAGQFCLFGLCVDKECENDDDCGGAPAHYCDEFLQCKDRKACEATDECNTWNKEGYCDQDTGFCMYDGHCWDDGDCAPGTCGPDHWCQDHNCYELYGPGCPPQLPICYMPSGEEPLCDGMPCATCVAPCAFDTDCPPDKECQAGTCNTPSNDCILDADCAEGQYCSPGCVGLKPACNTEADCEEGKVCLAGFCVADQVVSCQADEECATWAEGYTCQDGVCKPEGACMLDSQCEEGQYCHGICQPIPELPECKTDAGCAAEQICENEQCLAPPECYYDTQCPAGHVCEDQHCYDDDGVCAWLEKGPGFCDDGDPCTQDSCDAATGCMHSPGACD